MFQDRLRSSMVVPFKSSSAAPVTVSTKHQAYAYMQQFSR